jgi:hypothetical protein
VSVVWRRCSRSLKWYVIRCSAVTRVEAEGTMSRRAAVIGRAWIQHACQCRTCIVHVFVCGLRLCAKRPRHRL